MKRSITLLLVSVLITIITAPTDAQVLWRSAKTMKKGSIIAMGQWYYMDYTTSYDWANQEWKDFVADRKSVAWGFETMFGYGLTDRLEAMVHVPIMFKSTEDPDTTVPGGIKKMEASGIGDIYLKTRLNVMPWSKDSHGVTFTGSLRLPTGDEKAEIALGDGGIDVGLGVILSTKWFNGKHRGHLKINNWISSANDDTVKVRAGNQLKIIVKYDYNLIKQFMPFMTYIYLDEGTKLKKNGEAVKEKWKIRHSLCVGGVWKPKTGLFIRPKVLLPLGGEGGSLYSYKPVIDAWFIFTL